MARTVDHISARAGEGRLILGIGSGWFERDFDEYGYEFGTAGGRLDALERDLGVIKARWARLNPAPTREIPILIGGGGEKKTLRLVARYADACNLFGSSVADVKHKLEVLRGHCDAEGRDYDAITKTIIGRLNPDDPAAFLREMEQYHALGIGLVELAPAMPDPAGYVGMLGQNIVRHLAEIG
jgi:alkanesulfonate monooxygenase SsuD/methylene tetrahydromethanopterin reductase-like flavin-dependent oxidoreductase (luciferase family)